MLDQLRRVLDLAEKAQTLAGLLGGVRRVDETDKGTLERLINERRAIVRFFEDMGIGYGPYGYRYKSADFTTILRTLTVDPAGRDLLGAVNDLLASLRDDLRTYGDHTPDCELYAPQSLGPRECTCGWDAIWNELEKHREGERDDETG